MNAMEPVRISLRIPPNAVARHGGRIYRYRGRARDAERKHLLLADDGLPLAFSDADCISLTQQIGPDGQPILRFLSQAEIDAVESGKRVDWHSLYERASDKDKARVDSLVRYVRGWEQAGRPAKTENNLRKIIQAVSEWSAMPRISPAKLRRALAVWDGSLDSLVARHHLKGNRQAKADEEVWLLHQELAFKAYFAEQRLDVVAVHAFVLDGFEQHNASLPPGAPPLKPLSKSTSYKMLRAEGQFLADYTRRGAREAMMAHRAIGKAPQEQFVNETWEVDASPMPVILLDDASLMPIGRATITIVLDRFCRAIMGFDISWRAESLRSTTAALGMAIAPKDKLLEAAGLKAKHPMMGKPVRIFADQAAHTSVQAQQFKLVCEALGCEPSNARAKHPSDKGKIERMLRTYFFKVCHTLPGSTFSDIFERNKEKAPEKVAVCTIEEVRLLTLRFIVEVYHRRRHQALKTSPNLAFEANAALYEITPPPDPIQLMSMLSVPFLRTVQPYGVEVLGLKYNSVELMEFRQKPEASNPVKVVVDPNDVTQAWWFNPHDGRELKIHLPPSDRAKFKGWTLAKHELVRALQRNNPELMASDTAAQKAYASYVRDLMSMAKTDGLTQRRRAIRAWEKLRKQARNAFKDDVEDNAPQDGNLLDSVYEQQGEVLPLQARNPGPPETDVGPVGMGDVGAGGTSSVPRIKRPGKSARKAARSRSDNGEEGSLEVMTDVPVEPSSTEAPVEEPELESLAEIARRMLEQSRKVEE